MVSNDVVDYTQVRADSAKKQPVCIFDIDGTLALKCDRDIMDFSRVGEDLPNIPVLFVAKRLQLFSTLLIVSGREDTCRLQTEMWLRAQGLLFHALLMRPEKDYRPDHEIKKEIYERDIKPYYPNIVGVFDDRLSVIRMWESLGLFVFNVNNNRGEF